MLALGRLVFSYFVERDLPDPTALRADLIIDFPVLVADLFQPFPDLTILLDGLLDQPVQRLDRSLEGHCRSPVRLRVCRARRLMPPRPAVVGGGVRQLSVYQNSRGSATIERA
ncbi:MAG: hypothetical protein WDN69_21350 [Aliidongia sp.]